MSAGGTAPPGGPAGGRRTAWPCGTGDSSGLVGLVVEEGHVRPRSWRGRMGQYYRWVGREGPLQLRRRAQGTFFPRGSPEAVETAEHPTTTATTAGSEVVLDRYRLVRRLGGGGFGVVWLAHDLKLDRTVAVKRIAVAGRRYGSARRARGRRRGAAAAPGDRRAVRGRDRRASASTSSPSWSAGRPSRGCWKKGRCRIATSCEIGVALCDALAHAHKRGIIHRDVKPLNILVPDAVADGGAPAKLTDFGVARIAGDDALTRTGDVVGTLAYMAPEQAEGGDVGAEADLYALGLCLYEGLSGVNPVRGRGAGATARRVGQRLPPLGRLRRDLPLELCEAIDARGLAASRGARDDRRAARGADRRAGARRRRAGHDRRRRAGAAGAGRAAAAHRADPARAGRRVGRGPGGCCAALGADGRRGGCRPPHRRSRR